MTEDTILRGFSAGAGTEPLHRRLSDFVRELIRSNRLAAGTRLPGQRDLSELWGVNQSTVNKAFTTLQQEGWLRKNHGSGTFVRTRAKTLKHLAYYQSRPPDNGKIDFYFLAFSMLRHLLEMENVAVTPFCDTRPEEEQTAMPEEMAAAVNSGGIDGVIALRVNRFAIEWLGKLELPTAVGASARLPRCFSTTPEQAFTGVIDWAVARGCRSLGFISTWHTGKTMEKFDTLSETFRKLLTASPLEFHPEWFITPETWVPDPEFNRYGRDAAVRLFSQRELPDAVFIYPDVIAAIALQVAPRFVPDGKMPRLLLHRNRELPYYSEYPCDWFENSIERFVRGLLENLHAEFQGVPAPDAPYPAEIIPGVPGPEVPSAAAKLRTRPAPLEAFTESLP